MPSVFPDMTHKAADGFQPRIALCDERSARRPLDCGLRVDMRLPALGRKGGKALEQVFRIQHRESSGAAERPDKPRWPSTSETPRPGLRDLLQERDIGLGTAVDTAFDVTTERGSPARFDGPITRGWDRLGCPARVTRNASPCWRKISATSNFGRAPGTYSQSRAEIVERASRPYDLIGCDLRVALRR